MIQTKNTRKDFSFWPQKTLSEKHWKTFSNVQVERLYLAKKFFQLKISLFFRDILPFIVSTFFMRNEMNPYFTKDLFCLRTNDQSRWWHTKGRQKPGLRFHLIRTIGHKTLFYFTEFFPWKWDEKGCNRCCFAFLAHLPPVFSRKKIVKHAMLYP